MTTDMCSDYARKLAELLSTTSWTSVLRLAEDLFTVWADGRQLFLCGNGGSAANAIHLANDLIYGIGRGVRPGMKAHALSANTAVMTCLGNDRGYDQVFSLQLRSLAAEGDVLLALSGSGNSPNILEALKTARTLGMTSYAILGYDGGRAKDLADVAIHFPVDDMQIAEDLQLVAGHMAVQSLTRAGATSA